MAQIAGDSQWELQIILDQYKEILLTDRNLLIPIIASLSDLPLHDAMKVQISYR